MQIFQYTFERNKQLFISAFSICMTVPLTFFTAEIVHVAVISKEFSDRLEMRQQRP